jgi:hypothetical protein
VGNAQDRESLCAVDGHGFYSNKMHRWQMEVLVHESAGIQHARSLGRRKEYTNLETQCQICGLNPRVIHSRRGGHGLARSASVKGDEIVCGVEPGIVHLAPQPRRIQIQRVKQYNRGSVGLEGVDGAES